MYICAVRLKMPPDALRNLISLDNYINDELIRRLGIANANYAKLSKQINAVKKLHKRQKVVVNLPVKLLKQRKRNRKISLRRKNPKVVKSIQLE